MKAWKDNGLPPDIPFFMTEGNDLRDTGVTEGKTALWLADYVGSFLTAGGGGTYFFHYIASVGGRSGGSGFLSLDSAGRVTHYSPQYLATQIITKEWVQPIDQPHRLFKVSSDVVDSDGNVLVTAYAVERPDGQWAVMLINKDHDNAHGVSVAFADGASRRGFAGSVDRIVFGPNEYRWHPDPPDPAAPAPAGGGRGAAAGPGHADPDGPPSRSTVTSSGSNSVFQLPRASIVVLRGRVGN